MSDTRVRYCQFCLFYVKRGNGGGWCHRYPPILSTIFKSSIAIHPVVAATDFCGEFEPSDPKEEAIKYRSRPPGI